MFHRDPGSDAGEGIWCDGACESGITVAAVEVEETADAADEASPERSPDDDDMNAVPVPCWGRAAAEDDASLEVEEGGDGKREAPLVEER